MAATSDHTLRRRELLGSALMGTALATFAVPGTIRDARAYDPGQLERRTRYQPDSPDVRAFYRTNGYESLKK